MYAPERQQAILGHARSVGRVDVNMLAALFDVTPETIRRDLNELERRGLVRRVHGGAIPAERFGLELPVAQRTANSRLWYALPVESRPASTWSIDGDFG